jgi:hypothetical protein
MIELSVLGLTAMFLLLLRTWDRGYGKRGHAKRAPLSIR